MPVDVIADLPSCGAPRLGLLVGYLDGPWFLPKPRL
jgi:hypothetical protein